MIIFAVGILLIVYGLLSKKRFSVWIGMACVLLIMGFQEGVPGDYDEYKIMYQSLTPSNSTVKEMEYSYLWIIHNLPKVMNFHSFVFFSSMLQCLAMGLLIKRYVNKKYQFFGVLVVFFTFNIMLLQMKAMRQAYAIDSLLFAYILLDKKKIVLSLLMVAIAYGFHNSSLVAIALYFILFFILMFKDKKKIKIQVPSMSKISKRMFAILTTGALFAFYIMRFYLFDSYIVPLFVGADLIENDYYLTQVEENSFIAWWLMLYYLIATYAVTLYYCTEQNLFKKFLALALLVGFFIAVFVTGSGNLQRISAYFIIFSIVVLPNTVELINKTYGRPIAWAFVAINMLAFMRVTVPYMFSHDFSAGTGFGTYTFSFL